jgi:hypothetical protein
LGGRGVHALFSMAMNFGNLTVLDVVGWVDVERNENATRDWIRILFILKRNNLPGSLGRSLKPIIFSRSRISFRKPINKMTDEAAEN